MSFMDKIKEAAAQTNMNEAQKGGGERRVPEAGLTRLRFISYIELGKHHDEKYKKDKNEVILQFELSGPKHPVLELEDGRKVPFIITVRESISLNEKANFYKLFRRMNYTGEFTHIAEMLGKEFLGTVVHSKSEGSDVVYANLRDDGGYTIRPPFVEDPETGESRKIEVSAPLSPQRCFLWDYADKEQWDSIFVDGRWDDKKDEKTGETTPGKSKNIYQLRIKEAKNFIGSPISEILLGDTGGDSLELGEGERPERSEDSPPFETDNKAPADPLEGVA